MMWKVWLSTFVMVVTVGGTSGYLPVLRSFQDFSSPDGSPETRRDGSIIDIVFVLDDSSSIPSSVFQHALWYMSEFTRCSSIETGVGVIVYNCIPRTAIPLGLSTMGDQGLRYTIEYIMRQGGLSRTGPAIRYMKDTSRFHAGVHRVAVVLTDGFIEDEPLAQDDHRANAKAARDDGITLYSVGIGDSVDNGVLKDIAGDASRVFDDTDPCDLYHKMLEEFGKDLRVGDNGGSLRNGRSGGNSGDSSGNNGDSNGNNEDSNGNSGDSNGNNINGDSNGNSGDSNGNSGDSNGNSGDSNGNNGDSNGNNGDSNGNSGSSGDSSGIYRGPKWPLRWQQGGLPWQQTGKDWKHGKK